MWRARNTSAAPPMQPCAVARAHAGSPLAKNARVRAFQIVGVLVLVSLPNLARAGSGGFVPPMRVDVGPEVSSVEPSPGFQCVAGIHWASLYPKPKANIDVGVGIVSTTRSEAEPMKQVHTPDPLELFGGYVEVATRTNGNGWWRNWVGTRVESGGAWLDHRRHRYVGVATRVSTEAFVSGASSGGGGGVIGVLAVGFYGELSARRIDDVGNDFGVSMGVTMRVPLIAAN